MPYIFSAREQDGHMSQESQGKSGQEELVNFFAETATDDTCRRKRPPVKGSIERYFQTLPKGSTGNKMSTTRDTVKKSTDRDCSAEPSNDDSWGCPKCTFLNESSKGRSCCQMCGFDGQTAVLDEKRRPASSLNPGVTSCQGSFTDTLTASAAKRLDASGGEGSKDPDDLQCHPRKSSRQPLASDDSDLEGFFYTPVFGRRMAASSATSEPISSIRRTKDNRDSSNSTSRTTWTCSVCTLDNQEVSSKAVACKACGEPYRDSSDVGLQRVDDIDDIDDHHCAACSEASSQETSSDASTGVDGQRVFRVSWSCLSCTLDNCQVRNSQDLYTCEVCGADYAHPPPPSTSADMDATMDNYRTPRTARKHQPVSATASEATLGTRLRSSPCAQPEIDDGDPSPRRTRSAGRCLRVSQVIEIHSDEDEDSPVDCDNAAHRESYRADAQHITTSGDRDKNLVTFSVSKNSGRIFVHLGRGRLSTGVSFDLEQVLIAETLDRLNGSQAKRSSSSSTSGTIALHFESSGVAKVIQHLSTAGPADFDCALLEAELQRFVSSYVRLREVEKKAVQLAGLPIEAVELPKHVAQLLVPTVTGTDRYIGGAKERARERDKDGVATAADVAVLEGRGCAWCGNALLRASRVSESTYCSQECAEEGRLRRGGMYSSVQLRAAVFALECGKCTLCGIDCRSLFEQIRALEPPQRLNKLLSVNWKLPKAAKALENLLQNPKEGDFWQVDHIQAVAEGGGGCGLENLRTLCVPCHVAETEKLRGRLRLASPTRPGEETVEKRRRQQTKIGTFFDVNTKKSRIDAN